MHNQYAMDYPTLPINQRHSHLFVMLGRNNKPPDIWDTHGISGHIFVNPPPSSSSIYPGGFNPWIFNVTEHTSPHVMSETEHQFRIRDAKLDRQPEIQSSPVRETLQRIMERTNKDCRSQIFILTSSLHQQTFPGGKMRFKTEVCTCSQFPTETMLWIVEVEMVDSVDDLMSSSSMKGIQMPNFEVLDARIASALDRIIHNSHFKRSISLEEQKTQKQHRFLRGRQIAYLIYDYFRVTGIHDSVENYADLFTISLRNDVVQEFDSKWDGIFLSMTKIPPDDILEGLYTLRIRESEKLKTVLELYDLEIHQKKLGPDYHRLKTMVKRSIEQDIRNKNSGARIRNKNSGARNGNYEKNAVVKNQGTIQRVQRILGDCWQWEADKQCSKGDSCSFRHDVNKRGKVTPSNPSPNSFMQQNERKSSRTRSPRGRSPSGRMSRWLCKDYLKRTCTTPFCEKWHPPECLFYKSENGCENLGKNAVMHTTKLMNSQAKSL